jgi:hypothetical protein
MSHHKAARSKTITDEREYVWILHMWYGCAASSTVYVQCDCGESVMHYNDDGTLDRVEIAVCERPGMHKYTIPSVEDAELI